MMRGSANYDVKCILCGTEVGQILAGRFLKHAGCSTPMPRVGGMLRCCHCGGSLYFDPTDVYPLALDRAQIKKAFTTEAA